MASTENPQGPPESEPGNDDGQPGGPGLGREPESGQPQPEGAQPGTDGAGEPSSSDAAGAEELTVEDILAAASEAPPADGTAKGAPLSAESVEHLAQLQRINAEYANYRKRTEREKEVLAEIAKAGLLRALLPVLDDLARAEAHGDLAEGPMAVIAQKLRSVLEQQGLAAFGAKGDTFDPQIHEALVQLPSAEVERDTVADVVETGYRLGERLLRAAKVAVSTPAR